MANNNEFWIRWLDLLTLLEQLQPVMTTPNQWLSTTRSIPHWTKSVFSYTVTNAESLLTLNCLERSLSDESQLWMNSNSFITSRRPDEKALLRTVRCYSVVTRMSLLIFVAPGTSVWGFATLQRCPTIVFTETLPSKWSYSITVSKWILDKYVGFWSGFIRLRI
jgi:hypothetical protein